MDNYDEEFTFTVKPSAELFTKAASELNLVLSLVISIALAPLIPLLLTKAAEQSQFGSKWMIPITMAAYFAIIIISATRKPSAKVLEANKSFFELQEFTLTNEYIKVKTESSEVVQKWDSLVAYKEKKDYFAIYNTNASFFLISKDGFASDAEIERARGYFSKLPTYSILKNFPIKGRFMIILVMFSLFMYVLLVMVFRG